MEEMKEEGDIPKSIEEFKLPDELIKTIVNCENQMLDIKQREKEILNAYAIGKGIDSNLYTFSISKMSFVLKPKK